MLQQRFVGPHRRWIPSVVRHKAIVKNVKPTQVLDGKLRPKQIAEFVGGKKVKAHRDTASVAELDLGPDDGRV